MADIRPIRTEKDYDAALSRISELMGALSGPHGQVEDVNHPTRIEFEVLFSLVELYEARHYPIGPPTAIDAIEYAMEEKGLTPRDLVPLIGSRAKVSEVLSGKRDITMSMARALHDHLGISAEVLLQKPGMALADPLSDLDPRKFPLRTMAKRGWIPDVPGLQSYAEELIRGLVERADGHLVPGAPLYRKNDYRRVNAKTNPYALQAWCWQVLALANRQHLDASYEPGSVTIDFLRKVAQLSSWEDGPRRTQEFLAAHGIPLVILSHLPRTHLDGAVLRTALDRPVIGLTLRYDRIDNFWFCLLHELAHVGLHMEAETDVYIDDLSLRNVPGSTEDPKETEADEWAEEALIPNAVWETSPARQKPTAMTVYNLAQELGIHPAIVAGRVRYERNNYRLLSQFVGTGEVRRQFEAE